MRGHEKVVQHAGVAVTEPPITGNPLNSNLIEAVTVCDALTRSISRHERGGGGGDGASVCVCVLVCVWLGVLCR